MEVDKTRSRYYVNMASVYLAAQFGIHNPSRRKRAILERAIRIYTSAYAKLLELAREKESEIEAVCRFRESISTRRISDYLSRLFKPYAGSFPIHSSMRDSLYQDVARNLTSYFALKEKSRENSEVQPPSWPTIVDAGKDELDRASEYVGVLDKLREAESIEEIRTIESSIRRVMARREPIRIFFCRSDGNIYPRNFGLFHEPDADIFWARVFLLNGSECRKNPTQRQKHQSIPISKEKREIELRAGGAGYLLLPLECGEWQRRKFLLPLLDNPSMVRTATLCKKGDEFYLHITFGFGSSESVEPTSVLAVTLSNTSFVEVTVTDMRGNEIISKPIPYDTWWEEQKRHREALKRARAHGENRKFYFTSSISSG